MIRFTLRCPMDHRFDSWFASAAAFDKLQAAGHVTCAECGASPVEKAPMAPAVATTRSLPPERDPAASRPAAITPPDLTQPDISDEARRAALRALKARIEAETEYVGADFARTARAIHDGSAPERAIWGEARPDEARALIADGVPIAPLPFVPKRKTN